VNQLIGAKREDEMRWIAHGKTIGLLAGVVWTLTPILLPLVTFTLFSLLGGRLTTTTAFTALALFDVLKVPVNLLPQTIQFLTQLAVSMRRIRDLLMAEERKVPVPDAGGTAILVERATLAWPKKSSEEVPRGALPLVEDTVRLKDLNLTVQRGDLCMVVGPVGVGKTTILRGLLHELTVQGAVRVSGRVAYCSQVPWIMSTTVKENILFGKPFNEKEYKRVIRATALDTDIAQFEHGDATEIGDRGLNLSGGQKARLSLARAAYSDADVILLDDVIAAVDAHVAEHLMEKCIAGGPGLHDPLLHGKTRVVVTNSHRWLKQASVVCALVEADGECQIAACGKPTEVMRIAKEQGLDLGTIDSEAPEQPSLGRRQTSVDDVDASSKEKKEQTGANKAAREEDREVGTVRLHVWKTYATVLGVHWLVLLLSAYVLGTCLQTGAVGWLAFWSRHSAAEPWFYLEIYATLLLATALNVFIRQAIFRMASLRASRALHDGAIRAVFRAPMSWLDTTPSGRVINRMSSDLQKVDMMLQGTMQFLMLSAFNVLAAFAVVIVVVPVAVLIVLPMLYVYYKIQGVYRASSRELQRLEGIAKTPIYSEFSEALAGLSTIRAYKHESTFCEKNGKNLERQLRVLLCLQAASAWLSLRLGLIGSSIVACVVFSAVAYPGLLNPAIVGMAINYSLNVTDALNSLLQTFTNAEVNLVSLERVDAYRSLESEGETTGGPAAGTWPSAGEVRFEAVELRYRQGLPLVLKGVTFTVPGGSSCGIVGRTAAGKSSLLVALLRLAPCEKGCIRIDGVDLATVGLHTLRHALALIPQDPVLFSGTLAYNLDPLGEYGADGLMALLERLQLGETVRSRAEDGKPPLEIDVTGGGENFSVGQRQLLCLGRALLRRTRVMLLDEATASVDPQTDELIQKTLAEQMDEQRATLLCIAHRINTILSYDRVLVMEHGQVAEQGLVTELCADRATKFHALVEASGCVPPPTSGASKAKSKARGA